MYVDRLSCTGVVVNRSQVYINGEIAERIKKFLAIPCDSSGVSVSGFINSIVAAHPLVIISKVIEGFI